MGQSKYSNSNALAVAHTYIFLVEWFTRFKNGDGVKFR